MTIAPTSEKNNPLNLLYNEDKKHKYLQDLMDQGIISEDTAKSYQRIFTKTYPLEEKYRKDLHEFTFEEVEEIFESFKAKNRNTIESYARIISSYLNWALQSGLSNENVIEHLKPADFEKYLKNEEIYFTERQLRRFEGRCVNAQDAIILRLLFNGFGGKEMSEIRNLKIGSLDKENKLVHLVNTLKADKDGNILEFTERWESVDDRTIQLMEMANVEKIYQKRNGKVKESERENIRSFTDLVQNDYILRASITRSSERNLPVDKFVIHRRLQMLSEEFKMEKLTAKFIQRSGMINYANTLIVDEQLSMNAFKMVAKRFNLQSYHNLKGFLTVENIRKTHPLTGNAKKAEEGGVANGSQWKELHHS